VPFSWQYSASFSVINLGPSINLQTKQALTRSLIFEKIFSWLIQPEFGGASGNFLFQRQLILNILSIVDWYVLVENCNNGLCMNSDELVSFS